MSSDRTLQGKLAAILEESIATEKPLTSAELLAHVRAMGFETPEESAVIVREDRSARSNR
jgi:hypothetical protein